MNESPSSPTGRGSIRQACGILALAHYRNVSAKRFELQHPAARAAANHIQPDAVLSEITNQLPRCLFRALPHRNGVCSGNAKTREGEALRRARAGPVWRKPSASDTKSVRANMRAARCRMQNQHTRINCLPCANTEGSEKTNAGNDPV